MKTVTFDDDAYDILRGLKIGPKDSFSDVVKRHLGSKPSLEESRGGWSDMTDEEAKRLREETVREFGWAGEERSRRGHNRPN